MTARSPQEAHGRRQRADAVRNRDAITVAARREWTEHGRLALGAVARRAGVSRSTLHRHFRSRAALAEAVVEETLMDARLGVEAAIADERSALAMLRRIVQRLVELGIERRLVLADSLPLGRRGDVLSDALLPAVERIRRAAELVPRPEPDWLRAATDHFLHACLGADPAEQSAAESVEELLRALTDPLDQGLLVLDSEGKLVCLNARVARVLGMATGLVPGRMLIEPRRPVIYEDGSPCPADAYPLAVAIRTKEGQTAVLGHLADNGAPRWIAIRALPLRAPDGSIYGVIGIFSDVTAEKDWELGRLRPAGELAAADGLPLDIVRVLDEIPPHLFPEQFVSEACRLSGGPVALYVLDIDGTHLLRLAGPEDFPAQLEAPLALGPELAVDGIPGLRARLEAELPGVSVAPMWLRGRAVGVLLGLRAPEGPLVELGRLGAAALELAGGYTDVVDAARRRKETQAAAELQQSLLPARIARMGGGELAGSVLPSYEVGGDWFDYVENRDGAWIAIADAVGKGPTAGALGSIALAALRAARRDDQSLEDAVETMHEVTADVGRPEFFVTAIVARWNAVYSTFSWINCGHPPPVVVRNDDSIEQLAIGPGLPLGVSEGRRRLVRRQRRLEDGERLVLHSDGITARRTRDGLFGLDGIERATREAAGRSATAIARSIQEAVMNASEDPLQDDAVVVVLAPDSDRATTKATIRA